MEPTRTNGTLSRIVDLLPKDYEHSTDSERAVSQSPINVPYGRKVEILSIRSTSKFDCEIAVRITGPALGTRIVIDLYPTSDPRHPVRHWGFWDFTVQAEASDNVYTFRIFHEYQVVVPDDNLTVAATWIGPYKDENEYTISVSLFSENISISSATTKHYFGNVYELSQIQPDIAHLKSAVWFLTWKCNYKCSYCWEVQRILKGELKPEPYKDYKLWVSAWNKLKPEILDISGGEPFLQPNFIELINELDSSIRVAITSNLSFDVTSFVQKVPKERIYSLTFSYHPTQKVDLEMFIGRLLLIKNRGFGPITVNFVTWPEQIWMLERYKTIFESIGVRFHVDPYAATPHFPYEFDEAELAVINKYTAHDRSHWFGNTNNYNVACSGGVNHISVEPDGSAYRCIQDKVTGKKSLGNILNDTFELNSKKTFCDDFFQCPGCDRDKVDVLKVNVPFSKRT